MSTQFHTVGIIGRISSPGVKETLLALIDYLAKIKQAFVIEAETASFCTDCAAPCVPREALSSHCQLLIVIGGDGSLLRAVGAMVDNPIPVLGINRGRLGFLTDILPDELEKIGLILSGQYKLEKRFLLEATVTHQGDVIGQSAALNEIALIPDLTPHMTEFEIYIDNEFVCSQDSDGVIIATPTGSTAYALSGGGPILHPALDAMVIVPMFPHTLSIRPLVVEGDRHIRLFVTQHNDATPRLTCDGQGLIHVPPGSEVTIKKKREPLQLIHPLDYSYYASLRSKLHWGRKVTAC